jgi:hypothetical protein
MQIENARQLALLKWLYRQAFYQANRQPRPEIGSKSQCKHGLHGPHQPRDGEGCAARPVKTLTLGMSLGTTLMMYAVVTPISCASERAREVAIADMMRCGAYSGLRSEFRREPEISVGFCSSHAQKGNIQCRRGRKF